MNHPYNNQPYDPDDSHYEYNQRNYEALMQMLQDAAAHSKDYWWFWTDQDSVRYRIFTRLTHEFHGHYKAMDFKIANPKDATILARITAVIIRKQDVSQEAIESLITEFGLIEGDSDPHNDTSLFMLTKPENYDFLVTVIRAAFNNRLLNSQKISESN